MSKQHREPPLSSAATGGAIGEPLKHRTDYLWVRGCELELSTRHKIPIGGGSLLMFSVWFAYQPAEVPHAWVVTAMFLVEVIILEFFETMFGFL
ncbi:hypothetical protein NPJ88_005425 [Halomonas elongata]|uniref:hypothetical protein n=1 Tax=Halomonas elongata TaxID=2746 RepID=UPI00255A7543|nr:hypothetical protein [Halomonas elongata]MDL4861765.1 hypothetical protein [Halomonas elongata]